jgi:hypothetical protein
VYKREMERLKWRPRNLRDAKRMGERGRERNCKREGEGERKRKGTRKK